MIHILGADGSTVVERHSQLRDAGFEVIKETRHGAWQIELVVPGGPLGRLMGDGAREDLVGRCRPRLELRPKVFGNLGRKISHQEPDEAVEKPIILWICI